MPCIMHAPHLQLRPVLLHALDLQRLLLRLGQLALTHSRHLGVQGALHLAGNLLLATHILLVPVSTECRQRLHQHHTETVFS